MGDRVSLSPNRRAAALLAVLLPAIAGAAPRVAAASAELSVAGYVAGRVGEARGVTSWLDGGFGRLAFGAGDPDASESFGHGQLHLILDVRPSPYFGVFVHGVARAEPDVAVGREAGIVEAFVYGSAAVRRRDVFHYQLGHFILPTSRENVELGWSSPYTITFSALNTWIGEEVRPLGLLAEYRWAVGAIDELRFGASTFGGNDASGALLAWRGWSMSDRLTTFDEVVPLPPIPSLAPPDGVFQAQMDRGTRPLGSDLDSRLGYAGYLSYVRPQKGRVQWTRYDNRGDRGFHSGEYAWITEFDLVGFELHPTPTWSLAGEALDGSTGMGRPVTRYVQLDMKAFYVLASYRPGNFRVTLRYDGFETVDRDLLADAGDNDENGEAWTLAAFWEPNASLRVGVELLDLDADRPEAAASGFDLSTDARSVHLEFRYYFNW